ncbi:MAG: hypothetical protein WCG27_01425 [Pseudomonadota bacterium]
MKTDFETLLALAAFTINHLKEANLIDFDVEKRTELTEALATEYGVSFATDEDIKDQAIEEVEEKMGADNVPEDITESEIYNHARKEIIKSFNGENIGGLYLVESLHDMAIRINKFLLTCELINDVFATDEDISNYLISKIRSFSTKRS